MGFVESMDDKIAVSRIINALEEISESLKPKPAEFKTESKTVDVEILAWNNGGIATVKMPDGSVRGCQSINLRIIE